MEKYEPRIETVHKATWVIGTDEVALMKRVETMEEFKYKDKNNSEYNNDEMRVLMRVGSDIGQQSLK